MLINKKNGSLKNITIGNRLIDKAAIEWYEANKRIMHKITTAGREISLKFLDVKPDLKDGDILWQDENIVIAVEIKPCEAIVIMPATIYEASLVCYEIGNMHLALFYEGDELLVPYEEPLYKLLQTTGVAIKKEERKLTQAVKTTVFPHAAQGNSTSLFTKILRLTTSS